MSHTCPYCGEAVKIGQSKLTPAEKRRFDWGGPNQSPNIIEAQCVKAAAQYYEVSDWMALWDTKASVDENVEIMRRHGTSYKGGPTMRELSSEI